MSAYAAPAPSVTREPDPHGQAALLLVESLIHTLVGAQVLSMGDAIATVETARDAQLGLVDADRSPEAATELLEAVLQSMAHDLPSDPPHG